MISVYEVAEAIFFEEQLLLTILAAESYLDRDPVGAQESLAKSEEEIDELLKQIRIFTEMSVYSEKCGELVEPDYTEDHSDAREEALTPQERSPSLVSKY